MEGHKGLNGRGNWQMRREMVGDGEDGSGPLVLESGEVLGSAEVAWESYGVLNQERSNAMLICHALTGNAHAAGIDEAGIVGWWDALIGPGRAIDTDRWFVLCSNVLGGCYGSTGPGSIDPSTSEEYGDRFPAITIGDIVVAQRRLIARFGIERLGAVVGGSMGGMQAIEWGVRYPDAVDAVVVIAAGPDHSPWSVAFNAVGREALELGSRLGDPEAGLRLARKVAMISYRSQPEFVERFGRKEAGLAIRPEASDASCVASSVALGFEQGFAVERWLEGHGQRLVERFDPRAYQTLSHAMDSHDVARHTGAITSALARVTAPTLAVGISSDILYPAHEVRALADALPHGHYREIDSPCGHDAFLIEYAQLTNIFKEFFAKESSQ